VAGRITRKELKTDKFAVEVEHTVDFVTQHRRELVVYGSIAVAALLIATGAFFYLRHQHTIREQALADAIQIQEAPVGPPNPGAAVSFPTEDARREAAVKAFSSVATKYAGSNEAAIAKYYLGGIAADQGNLPEAEKRFKEAAAEGDKNYASLAQFSLAQAYVAEGRSADAEKIDRALMAAPTVFVSKEQATLALARAIATTRPAEARKMLEPLRVVPGPISQAAISEMAELFPQ
jgi:tetratricopeptide (TPR) repeat protein